MSEPITKPGWSAEIMARSDVLDMAEGDVKGSRTSIAASLVWFAERSHERKFGSCRSAMSMSTVYVDRAGDNLTAARRKTWEAAKDTLREAFGRGMSKFGVCR